MSDTDLFDGDPIPLSHGRTRARFPVECLPPTVKAMVEAVAEATQTDPAMPAVSALTALAAAAGGRAEVEIRRGWREPLCLYTATVAGPGERKSAVQAFMVAPLLDVEQELAVKGAAERIEQETLRQIAVKNAERLKAVASSDKATPATQADAIAAAAVAETFNVPPVPRIVADDVTPEAAGSLLAAQGGRLAIISAEGGVFDVIAGRYSNSIPCLDVWLKGHSGDPIKVDRKGREPEYIRRPALTLGLMLQPSILTAIGRNDTFRGRGLLARFLYAEPASLVGRRKAGAEPVPEDVAVAYHRTIVQLVTGLDGWGSDPAIILLEPAAASVVIELEESIEPTLAGDGELASLADWGSKLLGAIMRIAALLHLGQHGHQAVRRPLEASTVRSAAMIGDYFKSHAIRAFTTMQTDKDTADAAYLLDRLGKHGYDRISRKALFDLARRRFKAAAEMDPAITKLLDHGYLAAVPMPENRGPGRKPSPMFAVHPEVYAQSAQYAQLPTGAQSADSADSAYTSRAERTA